MVRKFPARCLKQFKSMKHDLKLPPSRCNTRHVLSSADICVFPPVACPSKHCTRRSEMICPCKYWKNSLFKINDRAITSLTLFRAGRLFLAKVKQTSVQCIVSLFQSEVRLFMTVWKLFKMLLRNAMLYITSLPVALRTYFVGQAESPHFRLPKSALPGEIWNST